MTRPTDTGPGDRIRATLHAAYGRPLTDDEVQFVNRQHEVLSVRLAEAEARAWRLGAAFLRAERRVELWEANQDQSTEIWLQRWGLHPGDLPDTDTEEER
jgi:hypothetical protein